MSRRFAPIAVPIIMVACGGGPPAGAPTPGGGAPAFAYAAAPTGSLTYEAVDSMGLAMDAGPGGTINVDIAATTTAEFDIARDDEDLLITVRLTSLEGASTNSMGPTTTVGNDDLPGPGVIRVKPNGEVEIVEEPEMSGALQQVLGSQSMYRRYFLRLPARAIQRGATWTDTVRLTEDNDGLVSSSTSIVLSTWSRDTVVNGRTLHVIDSELDNTVHVEGTTQGVEIVQNMAGTSTAVTLWDPTLHAIYQRYETGTATGSTDLPGMGVSGMPVSMRTRQLLRLRSGS